MFFLLALFSFALCQKCTKNKIGESDGGKFLIVGLFPMNCSSPNEIDNRTIAWMEAMKYTIEEANKLFNKSLLDYVIYDTYDPTNMDMTSLALLDSFKFYNESSCSIFDICRDLNGQLNQNQVKNILGFVGPAESSTSIYVHELTSVYKHIPIISYAAVSLELNDKKLYPNFFRTVPTDDFQAEFIKKVLQKYNWRYISVIAVDSSYGRAGLEILKQNYERDDICINVLEILQQAYDPQKYSEIATQLNTSQANVIVFWGQFKPLFNFLQEALKLNLSDRIWIISKAVGKNSFFLNFKNTLNNKLLFISYTAGEDQTFKNYFYSLTYENSSEWLKVIFERSRFGNNSNVNVKEIKEVFDLSGVLVVQNAVKVFIEAFCEYQGYSCNSSAPTELHDINDKFKFIQIIKNISFYTLNSSKPLQFNSNQSFDPIYFELYTYNESEFLLVDRWSYNATCLDTINNTKFELLKKISVCSSPCQQGYGKIIPQVQKCCWSCYPCSFDHIVVNESCTKCEKNLLANHNKTKCVEPITIYWSFNDSRKSLNPSLILLSSGFGILTSIFFIYTFIRKKSTPIVRSSCYELSLVQMIMHLIWFVLPFLTFEEEAYLKCAIRIYCSSLLHVSIVTILLVKTTRLVTIFGFCNDCRHFKIEMIYLRSKIAIILILFPCIFTALIFVVHNSKFKVNVSDEPDDEQDNELVIVQRYCDSTSFLIIYLCFVLILSFLCGIQSFKARNLPKTYNENKNIAYSLFLSNVILCVTVGLVSSNLSIENKKLLLCLLSNALNFLQMNFMFFNKVKIIWLNPKKNTHKAFKQISFKYEIKRLRIKGHETNNYLPKNTHGAFKRISFKNELERSVIKDNETNKYPPKKTHEVFKRISFKKELERSRIKDLEKNNHSQKNIHEALKRLCFINEFKTSSTKDHETNKYPQKNTQEVFKQISFKNELERTRIKDHEISRSNQSFVNSPETVDEVFLY
ncbi:extracellular calcium-sensing receptor-like [Hydra vulgaris]|uniref:Extracellular calcium-sensing receptor-like n=1 Tax=Hydra vulgaris TaxID=6087 RepID=A0ABM4CBG2_HYDVU